MDSMYTLQNFLKRSMFTCIDAYILQYGFSDEVIQVGIDIGMAHAAASP